MNFDQFGNIQTSGVNTQTQHLQNPFGGIRDTSNSGSNAHLQNMFGNLNNAAQTSGLSFNQNGAAGNKNTGQSTALFQVKLKTLHFKTISKLVPIFTMDIIIHIWAIAYPTRVSVALLINIISIICIIIPGFARWPIW